jgi:hypothetical protein
MKRIVLLLSVCLALTVGGKANAITLEYLGPEHGFGTANFVSTPTGVTPVYNPAAAGAFKMSGPVGEFVAFCLDITRGLQKSSEYVKTSSPWSFNAFSANTHQRIQTLFDSAYDTVASANSSAAFQILLWDAVYDTDDDPFDGAFKVSTSTGVQGEVSNILALVAGHNDTRKYNLTYFEATGDPQSQSLVTATPVPLPAAALLLLTALCGEVLVARRRKRA